MKWAIVLAIVLGSGISGAQQAGSGTYRDQFPDAPEPVPRLQYGGYAHGHASDPATYVIWTRKFKIAHAIAVGSILYDVEMTHEGLAHHKCAEGGGGITETHVSRKELYANDLIPFAAITGLDAMLKYMMREKGLAWAGYVFPTYSTILHVKGGTQWAMRCW